MVLPGLSPASRALCGRRVGRQVEFPSKAKKPPNLAVGGFACADVRVVQARHSPDRDPMITEIRIIMEMGVETVFMCCAFLR
ncbi:MAG TPA: hypothetical protein DGF30_08315 [Desulfomicrobium sp.]|nr:hypothetical protein [Desulfomicrobium sp.]